ncbi:HDL445Wp [Eremothecium sinecaudum]|uniref:Squalene synthase n=1 Tax=Eremothecium sinecaudum TaxID=45286 RepID=A0A0X8HRU1_9SACH|nr:HDL445Wp [Eremothecium sinecaudum]AMD20299.1 HDL445Wp [Eremothecium sinecaudum]
MHTSKIVQFIKHPLELKAALKIKLFRTPLYQVDNSQDSKDLKRCYELLAQTSRSFTAVIKELHPELRDAVMLFYLILRALDTMEDDMTIDPEVKVPLLRTFHEKLDLEEWNFTGNSEGERYRQVLVEFDCILREYHKLKPEYQEIIQVITKKMAYGMAEYILDEKFNLDGLDTVKHYDLYCHYVAGLVGEGLTQLLVLAKFATPDLYEEYPQLYESMGLFLQKTNIIRDYAEDLEEGRSFWPREIWSQYASQLADFSKPENTQQGVYCINHLVLNALSHVNDVLTYLSSVKEPSCFQFCAIPQVMAIATLSLVFGNQDTLHRNVKIRRGTTCYLILKSRTFSGCIEIFKYYLREIRNQLIVDDPNYLELNIQISKIEQFIAEMYQYNLPPSVEPKELPIYQKVKERSAYDLEMLPKEQEEEFKFNMALSMLITFLAAIFYHIL